MAEAGLGTLSIADPRACRTRIVQGRVTNLPSELSTAAPGTTISGEGVAILIDEGWIRWVATGDIARALEQLSKTEDNLPGLS